jgi:tripartite-type tricarboxylate transporter receptor subunit TctC
MINKRLFASMILLGAFCLSSAGMAHAQGNYPNKPIKMVLGFPAGGGTDAIARALAQKMGEILGQSVIVENKPGANGNIAGDTVAKSPADGYTILYNTSSIVISPSLYQNLSYNFNKDLTPVSLVANLPLVLLSSKQSGINNGKEFLEKLKANPGKLNYASAGNGNVTHLLSLMMLEAAGGKAMHLPYRGEAPALSDLAGGQVDFALSTAPAAIPLVRGDRVNGLAVSSIKRLDNLPNLPTLSELLGKPLDLGAWSGIMAPAGTSPEIIAKLNSTIQQAMQDKSLLATFAKHSAEPRYLDTKQYAAFMKTEFERLGKIVRDNGVKID